MNLLSDNGKKYLFIMRNKCITCPPFLLKYTLFKIIDKNNCFILSINKTILTQWHTQNIEKSIIERLNKDNNYKNLILFRIIECEKKFYYDIYLNVSLISDMMEEGIIFNSEITNNINLFEKIQINYLENLKKISINNNNFENNERNTDIFFNFKQFNLNDNEKNILYWMISKENIGNKYLNPNINYIPLLGSKYYLKIGDYNMIYSYNYDKKSYFKCHGGILTNELKYNKILLSSLISIYFNKKIDLPMVPEREFYIKSEATLILVPSELIQYWANEINKFFKTEEILTIIESKSTLNNISYDYVINKKIVISSYKLIENKVNNDLNNEISCMIKSSNKSFLSNNGINLSSIWWNRIIFDEYNNLPENKNDFFLKSNFKWVISTISSLYFDDFYKSTLKLLDVSGMNNEVYCKNSFINNCVWNTFEKTENKINNNVVRISLSDSEQEQYQILINNLENHDLKDKMNIIKKLIKNDNIPLFNDLKCIEKKNNKLISELIKKKEKQIEHKKRVSLFKQDNNLLLSIKNELNNYNEDLINMNNFFKNTINNISSKKSEFKCPICFSYLTDKMCITMCGHVLCFNCINSLLNKQNQSCPECRRQLNNKVYYYNNSIDNQYSSRIKHLIKFLKKNDEKYILSTHNDFLMKTINEILQKENINSLDIKGVFEYEVLNEFNLNNIKVLLVPFNKLNLITDIVNCPNIIILHPLHTEEQIKLKNILYHKLKTSSVPKTNIFHFVLKNTFEEEIKI